MLNNNIPHSPPVLSVSFGEAQSAIDFCPIHPLSGVKREREENGEAGERKQANSPLNNISTHIHTARAVFCAELYQWKISEKLVEGVVVGFSIHKTSLSIGCFG
jgi:hypothetical protein